MHLFKKHFPPLTFSSVLSRFIPEMICSFTMYTTIFPYRVWLNRLWFIIVFFWVLTPPETLTTLIEKTPLIVTYSPPPPFPPKFQLAEITITTVLFSNKNKTHLLTHSLTHLLSPTHSLIESITQSLNYLERMGENHFLCPKQNAVVFINFYNFNFAVFNLQGSIYLFEVPSWKFILLQPYVGWI